MRWVLKDTSGVGSKGWEGLRSLDGQDAEQYEIGFETASSQFLLPLDPDSIVRPNISAHVL
jgi:hypothetical protein